jgi:hypothetical protein
MTEDTLTPLERAVLHRFLAEVAGAERWDMGSIRVTGREFTGLGFLTDLDPSTAPRVAGRGMNTHWGKVGARLNGGHFDSSYVVFVEDGVVTMIEGYTYNDEWPKSVDDFEVYEEKQGEAQS